jgi:hypothetical protein
MFRDGQGGNRDSGNYGGELCVADFAVRDFVVRNYMLMNADAAVVLGAGIKHRCPRDGADSLLLRMDLSLAMPGME